jgi:hypothetical protein
VEAMSEILIKLIDSSAFWGFLGVFCGSLSAIIGSFINFWGQQFLSSRKVKRDVFGKLFGVKHIIKQYYISRFEAYIFSDYYEQKNHIRPSDLFLNEAIRWMKRSEDLVENLCRTESELKEIGAAILSTFSLTKKQTVVVKKLLDHKIPSIQSRSSEIQDMNQLDRWKEEAIAKLTLLVEDIFNSDFEKVIEILESKL